METTTKTSPEVVAARKALIKKVAVNVAVGITVYVSSKLIVDALEKKFFPEKSTEEDN